jgi:hypothetical protein
MMIIFIGIDPFELKTFKTKLKRILCLERICPVDRDFLRSPNSDLKMKFYSKEFQLPPVV